MESEELSGECIVRSKSYNDEEDNDLERSAEEAQDVDEPRLGEAEGVKDRVVDFETAAVLHKEVILLVVSTNGVDAT